MEESLCDEEEQLGNRRQRCGCCRSHQATKSSYNKKFFLDDDAIFSLHPCGCTYCTDCLVRLVISTRLLHDVTCTSCGARILGHRRHISSNRRTRIGREEEGLGGHAHEDTKCREEYGHPSADTSGSPFESWELIMKAAGGADGDAGGSSCDRSTIRREELQGTTCPAIRSNRTNVSSRQGIDGMSRECQAEEEGWSSSSYDDYVGSTGSDVRLQSDSDTSKSIRGRRGLEEEENKKERSRRNEEDVSSLMLRRRGQREPGRGRQCDANSNATVSRCTIPARSRRAGGGEKGDGDDGHDPVASNTTCQNEETSSNGDGGDDGETTEQQSPVTRRPPIVEHPPRPRRKRGHPPKHEGSSPAEASRKKRKARNFQEKLRNLREYQAAHGHCNVSGTQDHILKGWINKLQNNKLKITDDQRRQLDDINFPWQPDWNVYTVKSNGVKTKQNRKFKTFEERLVELGEYKTEFGHCTVPNRYDPNQSLAEWVKDVRRGKLKITMDQRLSLNRLGFNWETRINAFERKWRERFDQLRRYKDVHGHCNVPYKWREDVVLGQWVQDQRKTWKKGEIKEHRKVALEGIGFEWQLGGGGGGGATRGGRATTAAVAAPPPGARTVPTG